MEEEGAEDLQEVYDNVKLMKKSGQTEQERRTLRRSQRLLKQQLAETDYDVALAQQENDILFGSVCFAREALLDADNLDAISRRLLKTLERGTNAAYDADRLIRKLKSKFRPVNGRGFDWGDYSNQYGVWASAIPTEVSFLNGPLAEIKPPKVKTRTKRAHLEEEECEEERPEEVQGHMERTADQLSAVEESIKVLYNTLRRRTHATFQGNKRKLEEIYGGDAIPVKLQKKLKKHGVEIDAIQYLFNPNSFTQTVENIFHYSFLVKTGRATLKVKKKGFQQAPGGVVCRHVEEGESSHPFSTQAVLSLTMKDWRDLCQVYNVTMGDLPHRT